MTDRLANLTTDNLTTWLEIEALKLGTDSQRERWAHGLLPEDEITHCARGELYRAFKYERREKIRAPKAYQAIHRGLPTCLSGGTSDDVTFATENVRELDKEQWARFSEISALADVLRTHPWIDKGGGRVECVMQSHVATCSCCKRESVQSSVSVVIDWAGRTLVREYVL
jgi:hypothetical protein